MLFAHRSNDAATLAALNRVQAVIEFDLTGNVLTANSNFLTAVGYTLPEIIGQHHSLFVDPAHVALAEYEAFWQRLRAGELQQLSSVASPRAVARSG